MSLFYALFFVVVGILLISVFRKRHFLKFLFSMVGIAYQQNRAHSKDLLFLLENNSESLGLSPEETFALALGDLEQVRVFSEIEGEGLSAYLEQEWHFSFEDERDKEHILYILQKIWSEGTRPLLFGYMQWEQHVSIGDTVAFDATRFSQLLRVAIHLGYMEEEEAWGLLFLNAQRVQDTYGSWEAFQDAYFKGLTLYQFSKLKKKARKKFVFDKEMAQLKEDAEISRVWPKEEIFSHFETDKKP